MKFIELIGIAKTGSGVSAELPVFIPRCWSSDDEVKGASGDVRCGDRICCSGEVCHFVLQVDELVPTHAGVRDDARSCCGCVVSSSGVDHRRVDIVVGKDFEAEHVIVSEMVHNRRTFHSCLVSMAEDCVKVRDRPVVGLLVPDYGASHPCGDCLGGV